MSEQDGVPWVVGDLRERLALGAARGGALLTDEEQRRVEAILALEGDAALLHARLLARRPAAFRVPDLVAAGVDDVAGACAALVAGGHATWEVPWEERLAEATVAVLRQGCRREGLAVDGRADALRERLTGREGWDDAPWIAMVDRGLVLRIERWATLQVVPDRAAPVLERLGRLRWVDYPLGPGGSLVPDRAAWDAWERVVERREALTVEEALRAWDEVHWPPGGLDLRGELAWRLSETATALRRAGDLAGAEAILDALVARDAGTEARLQRARMRELAGEPHTALAWLADAREVADDVGVLAVDRAGRRLSRALGRGWPPGPPLRRPPVRSLALVRGATPAQRPRYRVGAEERTIERATVELLVAAGRRVLVGEGGLWRTILSLLLGPDLFVDVPGQLPVPRLPGPLDAGEPAFAARRPAIVWGLVDDLAEGRAAERLRSGLAWADGRVVAGVDPTFDAEALVELVAGLPPAVLLAVIRPLLAQGRRAAAGLPDLVVLPGEEVRLDALHPSRVGGGVHFVEVKSEQDAERDAQRVWADRLLAAGAAWEVWKVRG